MLQIVELNGLEFEGSFRMALFGWGQFWNAKSVFCQNVKNFLSRKFP